MEFLRRPFTGQPPRRIMPCARSTVVREAARAPGAGRRSRGGARAGVEEVAVRSGARLAPQEPGQWSDEARKLFGAAGSPLAILRMLAHQPALLAPFLGWAGAGRAGRARPPRLR